MSYSEKLFLALTMIVKEITFGNAIVKETTREAFVTWAFTPLPIVNHKEQFIESMHKESRM